jgi:pimeloyl-ACP methyl ester carboxylesterase
MGRASRTGMRRVTGWPCWIISVCPRRPGWGTPKVGSPGCARHCSPPTASNALFSSTPCPTLSVRPIWLRWVKFARVSPALTPKPPPVCCCNCFSTARKYEQAWLPHLIHQAGERVAKAISVLMDADDITDRVGSIRHLALVIHGRRDIPIPFDRGEELARAVPGSGPIAGIDSAGHTPPVSHPEHTLEAVTRFLSS